MPLPVIPDVVRVTFNWQLGDTGRTAHNIIHLGVSGASAEDALTALNTAFGAVGDPNSLFSCTCSDATFFSVDLIPLDGTSGTVTENLETTQGGTTGGDCMLQGCAVVSLHTGLRGPQHRGRIYTPFVGEGAQVDSILNATKVAGMASQWAQLVDELAAASAPLVVASYVHHSAEAVTAIAVRNKLFTQRRRSYSR